MLGLIAGVLQMLLSEKPASNNSSNSDGNSSMNSSNSSNSSGMSMNAPSSMRLGIANVSVIL
jgi:hypothetical protein